MIVRRMVHFNCRQDFYPSGGVKRLKCPDELVPWSCSHPTYDPDEYESSILANKDWADPHISSKHFHPNWNKLDNKIDRRSYTGMYEIVDGRPLNPEGRTGLKGRGILGKWGPNHAVDPIVTRWKLINGEREIDSCSKLPILQFCAILRRDCDQWALPGGMIDPGEQVNETLKREFLEEAFNSLENTNSKSLKETQVLIETFFKNGLDVYKGYVDDPRNTDNAWMETVAVNFHDESGETVGKFDLKAGDDAKQVKWIDLNRNLQLYASHSEFLKSVTQVRKSHW